MLHKDIHRHEGLPRPHGPPRLEVNLLLRPRFKMHELSEVLGDDDEVDFADLSRLVEIVGEDGLNRLVA